MTLQHSIGAVHICHNSMIVFICVLLGLPGDSGLEIGRGRTPSLRILQFIHTLQQQGPFIHTDPLSRCEWRAECIKVCQLLSQNQRMWSYFIFMLRWSEHEETWPETNSWLKGMQVSCSEWWSNDNFHAACQFFISTDNFPGTPNRSFYCPNFPYPNLM